MVLAENIIVEDRVSANGRTATGRGYFSGYSPKPLTEQLNILRSQLPNIGFPNQDLLMRIGKRELDLPNGAEGWFAIPNIWGSEQALSQFGGSIPAALQMVLDAIERTRAGKFTNSESRLDSGHLRQFKSTQESLAALSEAQEDPDILIMAGQFGIRHRDQSVSRIRDAFLANEFGLGAFAVGIMLLMHPMRLWQHDDLWIDCAGDEILSDETGEFVNAPFFHFNQKDILEFGAGEIDGSIPGYGTPSGFLCEQLH